MADALTVALSSLGAIATLVGVFGGVRGIQANRRRIRVRLEALSETITIIAMNPGDKPVPLSGVRLRTPTAALPLDKLTEGHFPLSLPPGTSYRLPLRRDALVTVLERNGLSVETKLQAEVFDATGKVRRSSAKPLSK